MDSGTAILVVDYQNDFADPRDRPDAIRLGFAVCVHTCCVRAVDPAAGERALAEMAAAGAVIM